MEFLVHGAKDFDEPGVFMSFEERDTDLAENFASLGFDIDGLMKQERWPSITSTSREAKYWRREN